MYVAHVDDLIGGRRGIDQNTTAAVDLDINETGGDDAVDAGHRCGFGQIVDATGLRNFPRLNTKP